MIQSKAVGALTERGCVPGLLMCFSYCCWCELMKKISILKLVLGDLLMLEYCLRKKKNFKKLYLLFRMIKGYFVFQHTSNYFFSIFERQTKSNTLTCL